MAYVITNLTYSPLRIMINSYDRVLPARPKRNREIQIEKTTKQLKKMHAKGLIKIREV